jgi:DNA-binding transcriptional LysR family regulator
MTLLQLQVFVAVCQEKSFTRAGEMLKMTQSAVSQAISNLENELGVRLLIRDRHRITVTQIGERVLSHARDMIQHTFEMKQEAVAATGTESGTLRIATAPGVAARLLPGLLASFRARHPDVQITLFEGGYDEINSWLTNHRIDVGFTALPTGNLDVVSLVRDRFLLFVPTDHILAQHTSVSLEKIQDEHYIQLKAEDGIHVIKEAFKQQGMTRSVQFEFSETCTILAMVQRGFGVTILPESAIPDCSPDVVGILLDPPVSRNVGFVVRDMNRVSPICADFILHAREYVMNRSDLEHP